MKSNAFLYLRAADHARPRHGRGLKLEYLPDRTCVCLIVVGDARQQADGEQTRIAEARRETIWKRRGVCRINVPCPKPTAKKGAKTRTRVGFVPRHRLEPISSRDAIAAWGACLQSNDA